MQWKYVDGPANLKEEWKFKAAVGKLFADACGVAWVKKSGGARYGKEKVCGHHIYNCTLRPLELAALPGPSGPSTSSDAGPSPAPSAAAESSDESEDERGAGPSTAPSAAAGDGSESDSD